MPSVCRFITLSACIFGVLSVMPKNKVHSVGVNQMSPKGKGELASYKRGEHTVIVTTKTKKGAEKPICSCGHEEFLLSC